MKKVITLCLFLLLSIFAKGQSWQPLGPIDSLQIALGGGSYTSIAIDNSGTPYLGFADAANGSKASVKKYNGTSWIDVGTPGFSTAGYISNLSIIINNGTPYVVYINNNRGAVQKFNGTAWVNIDTVSFSSGYIYYPAMAINASGTPYVVYTDVANSFKATVKKFNGSSWVNVGAGAVSPGRAYYTSIDIDGSGVPYITYQDGTSSNRAVVKKFDGTNWVNVGTNVSVGGASANLIKINAAGMPYLFYADSVNGLKATVRKYNGSNWVDVGTPGFSMGAITNMSLAIAPNGIPYVAYRDQDSVYALYTVVQKFDGTNWVNVGTPGLSVGTAGYLSLTTDGNNKPYIAFSDNGNGNKPCVKNFDGTNWIALYGTGIADGAKQPFVALDTAGIPYIVYTDGVYNDRITARKYDGSNWALAGARGFSLSSINNLSLSSIIVNSKNIPYAAYGDGSIIWVKKFDGSSWVNVGQQAANSAAAYYPSMALGINDTPYIAFSQQGALNTNTGVVKKFDGINWVNVSTTDLSANDVEEIRIAVDGGGVPYVAFSEENMSTYQYHLNVKKYDGYTWVNVGPATISGNAPVNIRIAPDGSGIPYIAYYDRIGISSNYQLKVKKFDGTNWIILDSSSFPIVGGSATSVSLAIGIDNQPYISYPDVANGGKVTVKKYDGISWGTVGAPTISTLSAAVTGIAVNAHKIVSVYQVGGNGIYARQYNLPLQTIACNSAFGLAVTNITTSSAAVNWTAVPGAVGYEYIIDQVATAPAISGAFIVANAYTATGLAPNATYYFHLRTRCGNNSYSAWTTKQFITPGQCDTPINPTVTNITFSDATINWAAVIGASGYEYTIDQTGIAPLGAGTPTTATTYNATGLAISTVYYVHVRTDCGGHNYSSWVTRRFTTADCNAPTNLAVSNITGSSAAFNWTAIPSAVGYEYLVDQLPFIPATPGSAVTINSRTVSGLTNQTVYYFHVRTICGSNTFSPWITIQFTTTTGGPTCDTPSTYYVNNITSYTAVINWTRVLNELDYEYTVDQVPTAPVFPGTVFTVMGLSNSQSVQVTGLTPNTLYYAHFRSSCRSPYGYSAWITRSFTTPGVGATCDTPTTFSITNITANNATLSWPTVPSSAGYEYTVDQVASAPAVAGTYTVTTTQTVTGLMANTLYYAHLRVNCANPAGYTAWITRPFTTLTTSTSGITNISSDAFGVTAYPNPTNGVLTIHINGHKGHATLKLLDVVGKTVSEQHVNSDGDVYMDLRTIAGGTYWLKYIDDSHTQVINVQKY